MNWAQAQGQWKQLRGKVREQWGKLTDDDLDKIASKKDQPVGKIQQQYGIAKEEAERAGQRIRTPRLTLAAPHSSTLS